MTDPWTDADHARWREATGGRVDILPDLGGIDPRATRGYHAPRARFDALCRGELALDPAAFPDPAARVVAYAAPAAFAANWIAVFVEDPGRAPRPAEETTVSVAEELPLVPVEA